MEFRQLVEMSLAGFDINPILEASRKGKSKKNQLAFVDRVATPPTKRDLVAAAAIGAGQYIAARQAPKGLAKGLLVGQAAIAAPLLGYGLYKAKGDRSKQKAILKRYAAIAGPGHIGTTLGALQSKG